MPLTFKFSNFNLIEHIWDKIGKWLTKQLHITIQSTSTLKKNSKFLRQILQKKIIAFILSKARCVSECILKHNYLTYYVICYGFDSKLQSFIGLAKKKYMVGLEINSIWLLFLIVALLI